eukprot:159440_1
MKYVSFGENYVFSIVSFIFLLYMIIAQPIYFYATHYQLGQNNDPNQTVLIDQISTCALIAITIAPIFSYKIYVLWKWDANILREEFVAPEKMEINNYNK